MKFELTGQRFERLVVTGIDRKSAHGTVWRCQCDCGNERVVREDHLRSGNTKSCGCLRVERSRASTTKHGVGGTPEYNAWYNMIQRCDDPTHLAYPDYGGRGITVCPEWRDVSRFVADMGRRPTGLSLDRVDNERGYEPGNCRWSTRREQATNTRKVRDSRSGIPGVHVRGRRYGAFARVDRKGFWLGTFDTVEEAVAARGQFLQNLG